MNQVEKKMSEHFLSILYYVSKHLSLFAILAISLFLSGCSLGIGGGGGAKVPAAGEFVKGAVVKDFPNLPLFQDAQVIESYGSTSAYGASFIAKESLAKVVNFYNSSLPQLGWQVNVSQSSSTNYVFDIKDETYTGSVIVNTASDSRSTAITMSVAAR